MVLLLEILLALGLIAQAAVGLAFFISCCWEGERRAAFWAGVQAAAMVAATVLFLYLWHSGFFSSGRGVYLLILAACLATGTVALLTVRMGANPIARQGTLSLIAGPVARFASTNRFSTTDRFESGGTGRGASGFVRAHWPGARLPR